MSRPLAALAAVCLLAGCAAAPRLEISPTDPRSYDYRQLDNGLDVLLISDPETRKSAAAMAVFRGSYHEPEDRPGLAHYLEHMLFLGTEKYPDVDGYHQFISRHGGGDNAYTAQDHTNYFFDIQPEYLEGALDRFAQFFIAPLFDIDYVEREKHAVSSEYKLQLKDDGWRGQAVRRVVFDDDHPASRFTIGNLETLDGEIRKELIDFYENNYSADQMALVVLGREPTSVLAGWVSERFAAIPNRNLGPAPSPGDLFEDGTLPRRLTYETQMSGRSVTYHFPLPPVDDEYREKPAAYIANLLGHEGENSLYETLKSRGWIERLGASGGRFDAGNGMISVRIDLTDAGAGHVHDITASLFDTIDKVRRDGVDAWRYEEQSRIADLDFRFQESTSPLGYVYRLAPMFRLYPPHEVLSAPYLMEQYEAAEIREMLDYLRRDNVLIEVAGPQVETDAVEKWFHVPYRLDRPDFGSSASIADVDLPEPNPFIPTDLTLVDGHDDVPQPLTTESALTTFLATDTSFDTPRGSVFLELAVEHGITSARDHVMAALYTHLVNDRLNSFAYPAQLAGLNYGIAAGDAGFMLSVSGYSDKQDKLLEAMVDAFVNLEIDPERVALYREQLVRDWRNFSKERPYAQAYATLNYLLLSSRHPPSTLADIAEQISAEELVEWRREHTSRFNGTLLVHGNYTEVEAREIAGGLAAALPLADFEVVRGTVATPSADGPTLVPLEIEHDDAATVIYLQGRDDSYLERARMGLLAQLISTRYFTALRTQQQLGYVVTATPAVVRGIPGIAFIVQSPVVGPGKIVDATRSFLDDTQISAMAAEAFAQNKAGLIAKLMEKDRNLLDRTQRFWNDVELGNLDFDTRERIAEQITDLDQEEMSRFFADFLERFASRRLVVFSAGRFPAELSGRVIQRIDA